MWLKQVQDGTLMEQQIIEISNIIRHSRRLKIFQIIINNANITAKELSKKSHVEIPLQYLYDDLKKLRIAGLINRAYSEDANCFVYTASCNKIIIDFTSNTIEIERNG